jgi:hypothetical protein
MAASCFDNVKNGDETDVDCGGSCSSDCYASQYRTNSSSRGDSARIGNPPVIKPVSFAISDTSTDVNVGRIAAHDPDPGQTELLQYWLVSGFVNDKPRSFGSNADQDFEVSDSGMLRVKAAADLKKHMLAVSVSIDLFSL